MRTYEDQPSGTVDRLRALRREAPEPERRLLRGLRETFPGLKWRHQSPRGPFKPDIFCFSERLVIEVDGDTHPTTATYDASRTAFLEREGYRVLRFNNADVMSNLEGVIAAISFSLREKEGAPKARKDEGDLNKKKGEPAKAASPSPRAATRLTPLPKGEGS